MSICDASKYFSVPPSEKRNLSDAAKVTLEPLVAASILTIAVTSPNSNALAPEFTFNICPALPIERAAPIPPCDSGMNSPDWYSANPVATLLH